MSRALADIETDAQDEVACSTRAPLRANFAFFGPSEVSAGRCSLSVTRPIALKDALKISSNEQSICKRYTGCGRLSANGCHD
jgi:hypothetical protein